MSESSQRDQGVKRIRSMFKLLILLTLINTGLVHAAPMNYPQGWVNVRIEPQQILAADDEFLGSLIELGLDLSKATWIKPAFGNDNMLWFIDEKGIGRQYYERLNNTRPEQFPGVIMQSGEEGSLQYTGYQRTDAIFVHRVYRCKQTDNKTILLFWSGDKTPKYQDLKLQLEKLQGVCTRP